jgi:hypothetical protein
VVSVAKVTGPDAVKQIQALIDRQEPSIRKALNEAFDIMRQSMEASEIVRMLEAGNISGVLNLASPMVTSNALQPWSASVGVGVLAGAELQARIQDAFRTQTGDVVNVVFNATNPALSDYANTYTTQRVREIGDDVRNLIRQVIRDETVAGNNPLTTARRIRDSIGLTAKQEQAVTNFRNMLDNLDSQALSRALRDKRFDPTVLRAIQDGNPLSQKQIDRMVDRYRSRYVKYRSQVIARTEAMRSVNGGAHALMKSYVDAGVVDAVQVRRFWHYTHDGNTRSAHVAIPSLNTAGVGIDEAFITPLGPLMFPGDPSGAAANTINCRCTAFNRIISAELIARDATNGNT